MIQLFLSENLKRDLVTSRKIWQYIIKAELQGLRCKNVNKIHLAQEMDLDLWVP